MAIHWCGTGLSAAPGLRRLIAAGQAVTVWERDRTRAQAALGDLSAPVRCFGQEALAAALRPEDVLVAMVPAEGLLPLAELALARGAHFVCASYISPRMRALHAKAQLKGVSLVNEVGLDPGIDHLMAHALVADYRASPRCDASNALNFHSYCGGIPKHPEAFRYKFSWSPLGVLTALKTPAVVIRDYRPVEIARVWQAVSRHRVPLPRAESFEVYPNRDSRPFVEEYRFDPTWRIESFQRGSLRPMGWAAAWQPVFEEIERAGPARLAALSERLWADNAYGAEEPDRVVMCVSLSASDSSGPVWHKSYVMDAWGDTRGSAMARLVSVPVALAAEAAQAGALPAGVQAAPSDPETVARWLAEVARQAQHLALVDHG